MSLAARCPACGTVFRVVQDQLRVSEGWVRCGRCSEVFNAIETLVDLDADAASRAAPRTAPAGPGPRHERVLEDFARVAQQQAPATGPMADHGPIGTVDLEVPGANEAALEAPAAAPSRAAEPGPGGRRHAPMFVVQADRAARWRRPGVRAALILLLVGGALLLAAQIGFEYRDSVAARWPLAREPLEQLCALQGCRIDAPRAIDAIAVESSGLVRAEGSAAYRLSVVLRNRAPIALALPAIDVTLTDTQGAVIARRVIRPAEMGAVQGSIAASSDLPLQAILASSDRPISGYTIEIFYP